MQIKKIFKGKAGLFFWANTAASVGMNIGVVGVSWFIIDSTKQNEVLGIYGAVSLLSAFIALISSGSLIDKYNKISIMKFCCLGQAFVFLLAGLAYACGVSAIRIIYGLAVFNMPCMVIFTTASRGALPAALGRENLGGGNSLLEITVQSGAMVAALLTGFLYPYFGFSFLIFTGSAITLTPFILLSLTKYSFDCAVTAGESFFTSLKQGFFYLKDRKRIFFYGLAAFMPTVVISAANIVMPGYVEQHLGAGATVYGFADMLFAAGAMAAGFMLHALASKPGREYWQTGLFLSAIITFLFFAVNKSTGGFLAVIIISGLSLAGLRILLSTVLMELIEEKYLGRCLSFLTAVAVVFQAVFAYIIGAAMDSWGIIYGFVILTLIICGGFIVFLIQKKRA